MKTILLLIYPILVIGCCQTVPIGAKPDINPAVASNAATKQSIGEARNLIKKSQDAAAKGDNSLDKASKQIDALLGP